MRASPHSAGGGSGCPGTLGAAAWTERRQVCRGCGDWDRESDL